MHTKHSTLEDCREKMIKKICQYLVLDSDSLDRDEAIIELRLYSTEKDDGTLHSIRVPKQEVFESIDHAMESACKCKTLELSLNRNAYECAVTPVGAMASRVRRQFDRVEDISDILDSIEYSIGLCTFEYAMFLLAKFTLFELNGGDRRYTLSMKYRPSNRIANRSMDVASDNEEITWKDYLTQLINIDSLRITTGRFLVPTEFGSRATAYEFKFMYHTGSSINRVKTETDLFYRERPYRANALSSKFTMAPQRKIAKEVVDYYRMALAAEDAYLKYISYYHVLEYYFPYSFNRLVAESLRKRITNRNFDLTDDKLLDLANEASRLLGGKDLLGYGKEKDQLEAVLNDFVQNAETLKNEINRQYQGFSSRYSTKEVSFVQGSHLVDWDSEHCLRDVAIRVYSVRNALIHSKGKTRGKLYRPFEDRKELDKEIPLIKVLSEMVIDGAGECWREYRRSDS